MNDSKNVFKRLGSIGIGLCALCCMLPIAPVVFGMGALAVVAKYLEWIGITILSLALLFFGIYFYRKQKAPACDIDCKGKEGRISKEG